MNTIKFIVAAIIFVSISAFISAPSISLSPQEQEGLIKMREEEKLAHDVYKAMIEKWDHQVFKNISQSEARHTEMVKNLLAKYNLEDPYVEGVGKFQNTELQTLYNQLVTKGSQSLQDAFEVGATIEDLDIADLDQLLSQTEQKDLVEVYTTLRAGSYNHMNAFIRQLSKYDVTYQPKYMSESSFLEVQTNNSEKGNQSCSGSQNQHKCGQKGGCKSSTKACAGKGSGGKCHSEKSK